MLSEANVVPDKLLERDRAAEYRLHFKNDIVHALAKGRAELRHIEVIAPGRDLSVS